MSSNVKTWSLLKVNISKAFSACGDLIILFLLIFYQVVGASFGNKMSDLKVWAVSVPYQAEVIKPGLFGNKSVTSPNLLSHQDQIYFPGGKYKFGNFRRNVAPRPSWTEPQLQNANGWLHKILGPQFDWNALLHILTRERWGGCQKRAKDRQAVHETIMLSSAFVTQR